MAWKLSFDEVMIFQSPTRAQIFLLTIMVCNKKRFSWILRILSVFEGWICLDEIVFTFDKNRVDSLKFRFFLKRVTEKPGKFLKILAFKKVTLKNGKMFKKTKYSERAHIVVCKKNNRDMPVVLFRTKRNSLVFDSLGTGAVFF